MATESEKKLEKMLTELEKTHAAEGKNFRALLDSTPELKTRMLEAIGKGNLEKFEPLDASLRAKGAVGAYDAGDKSILLPMDYLKISDKNTKAANLMRATFGHEIEHAVNRDDIKAAQDKFINDALKVAIGPSPHNYTDVLKNFNADQRNREARDEIAGVNVLAAHIKRENPSATKAQLYEKLYNASPDMQGYFDAKGKAPNLTYEPKAGITFNDKFQLEATKDNVAAFGKHFYDKQGYPALYGQNAIDIVGKVEKLVQDDAKAKDPKYVAPQTQIDLNELGLKGKGVTLPAGFKDISPRMIDTTIPAHEITPHQDPRRADGSVSGGKQASTGDHHLDDLLSSLKDPVKLREAMETLAKSSDGQQFQQSGKTQLQEQEGVKFQEAARLQPTQESPTQETPRGIGGR